MLIPLLIGGALVYFVYTKAAPQVQAPAAGPSYSKGLTSGGAYYQGYLDQINQAVDQYNASNKQSGTDDSLAMRTLMAVMAVAQKDSGWNGHLTTTDMYNLNEAYKAAVGAIG